MTEIDTAKPAKRAYDAASFFGYFVVGVVCHRLHECIGLQGSLWRADVSAAGLALAVEALGAGRERRRPDGRKRVAHGKRRIQQWHVHHSLTSKTR